VVILQIPGFSLANWGSDTITDFVVEFDDFVVTAPSFGGQLVAGALLPAAQFNYGMMASGLYDRFIYDNVVSSSTFGTLFYDVDGMGGTEQVAIANLVCVHLTANDIFVFGSITPDA